MEISYPYHHMEINASIRRVHETSSQPILAPYGRPATTLSLPCLTLQRGWRAALEDRGWVQGPLSLSLGPFGCKKIGINIEEGLERAKDEGEQKLKFGVDSILSSEFGNQRRKLSSGDKYWWQQANPSLLAATRSGLGYSSSIHIPAESSYTYPSIITPAHVDTPGTVLPHYAIDKCGYGYMTSSYGHIKQSEMLGGQDMSYKGAPRRKKTWSRAVFTSLQRRGLEKRFEVQKYVNKPDRKQLASALGLTDSQVKVWFQNRRMKWRHSQRIKKQQEKAFPNSPHPELPD